MYRVYGLELVITNRVVCVVIAGDLKPGFRVKGFGFRAVDLDTGLEDVFGDLET